MGLAHARPIGILSREFCDHLKEESTLVKRLIRGTHQGRFEPKYLQNYLDEYVFRFNRRKSKYIGKKFMRIVEHVMKSVKLKCSEIKFDLDPISEFFALELSE
jgi:hypothetical protein